MTSRGSRRLLLSGNELKERGRREAPLLFVVRAPHALVMGGCHLYAVGAGRWPAAEVSCTLTRMRGRTLHASAAEGSKAHQAHPLPG